MQIAQIVQINGSQFVKLPPEFHLQGMRFPFVVRAKHLSWNRLNHRRGLPVSSIVSLSKIRPLRGNLRGLFPLPPNWLDRFSVRLLARPGSKSAIPW